MRRKLTLFDAFLIILERDGNDVTRNIVRKIKILINVPECSEYLNCILINSLGFRYHISAEVVDKAVDFVIHLYEDDIECFNNATREQKEKEKTAMRCFMEQYCLSVKEYLRKQGLLR